MHIPDYSQYTFEDFIMDTDFRAWVLTPNAESRTFWDAYLAAHPTQKPAIEEAILVVQHLKMNEEVASQESKQRIWQTLEARFDERRRVAEPAPKVIPFKRVSIFQWAAVITLLLTMSAAGWFLTQSSTQHIHTAYGETRQLTLPDCSQVMLNGNSTLTYQNDWSDGQAREVWLEGEAFFKVTKQYTAQHRRVKFVTHTPQLNVSVVGTQFNVNTRRGKTEVMLVEGKVRLSNPRAATGQEQEMLPGQLASLQEGVEKVEIHREKPEFHTAWVKGSFVFDNTPLVEVATLLEDTYGLPVVFEEQEMMDLRLTANLSNQDLPTLLQVIASSFNLNVQQTAKQITIRRK